MQVVQIPRLEGLKSVIFAQRLLVFNETFAPVGDYAKSYPVVACVWDEPTAGRTANEILSCFSRIIENYKDKSKIVLWLDNCSAQNKNWNLFLYLILLINSPEVQVQELILKYFESRHTFMAADSFHAAVEARMRRGKAVTTMNGFEAAVKEAKKRVDVLKMEPDHFFFHRSMYHSIH